MEELLLGQSDYSIVFHAEQRGGSANRVFGIDHYNTTVAQFFVLFYKVSNIDVFCEYFIRQLQIGRKVIRVF